MSDLKTTEALPPIGPCAECGVEIAYGESYVIGRDMKRRHAVCETTVADAPQTSRTKAFRDVRDAITRLGASASDGEYKATLWDALCAVRSAEKAPLGFVAPKLREIDHAE